MSGKTIVAVGAHTDDLEYGCGGSIYQHVKAGDEVIAVVLGDGKRGGHKLEEAQEASRILGIKKLHIGPFPDGDIPCSSQVVDFLRQYINDKVQRVYGPIAADINLDHVNTSLMVKRVADLIVPEILLYEGPRNTIFNPNFYIKIGEEALEHKIASYGCYLSQQQKGSLFPDVEVMARLRGSRSRLILAEAFEVHSILQKEIQYKQ